MSTYYTSMFYPPKRSRAMSASEEEEEEDSDYPSEESGQFDDAVESDSEQHSAKRRRSNDWPLNDNIDGTAGIQRWKFPGNGSPRGRAGSGPCRLARGDRPRRSRFIEERMSDSVSAKPPSIFTGEPRDPKGQRNSGIFRFGKAIASAFNPFGAWSSGSETSKTSTESERGGKDDAVLQAERAYEELKKAGFKGTKQGGYIQHGNGNRVDSNVADQTWKMIQEKMEYGAQPSHSHSQSPEKQVRQDSTGSSQLSATPGRRDGTPLLSPFQDLRRAKSAFAIPYIKRHGSTHSQSGVSEPSDEPEVRRQKSRKEIQRQTKLIKKVSNLEEKLDKARRELRELSGDGEVQPQTLCMERPYTRKFVPGALPSLPSERLLESCLPLSGSPEPETEPPHLTLMSPNVSRMGESQEDVQYDQATKHSTTPRNPKSSKRSKKDLALDSSPRKRKSPNPETKREPTQTDRAESMTSQTPRRAKLQKTNKDDSPRAAEQKQFQPDDGPSPSKKTQANIRSPRLRMRKGQTNLRSAIGNDNNQGSDPEPHSQYHTQEAHTTKPTLIRIKRNRRSVQDSIPPVPPIPKDFIAAAASVDTRFVKEPEPTGYSTQSKIKTEEFSWPEDCF
ncbi:nuclear RNA binding protein [Aspergillus sclerotialis]|uniref:Nuclear RNA binding protein n=1 Tax=Aspergillus sclerotialis TaxID=2070753 RepID=A0A3A2ZIK9_9EURO|nr:nuclear RNA binding protein [Aspergillus sclerotialis]